MDKTRDYESPTLNPRKISFIVYQKLILTLISRTNKTYLLYKIVNFYTGLAHLTLLEKPKHFPLGTFSSLTQGLI